MKKERFEKKTLREKMKMKKENYKNKMKSSVLIFSELNLMKYKHSLLYVDVHTCTSIVNIRLIKKVLIINKIILIEVLKIARNGILYNKSYVHV